MSSARELARLGRIEQLKVLAEFEAGKEVSFKVHNKPEGYKLSKAKVVGAPPGSGPSVLFPPETVFLAGAADGDLELVNECLAKDPSLVNATDADGLTALHKACVENYVAVATTLIGAGAPLNAADNDGWTPLHSASSAGAWRICNQLISNGADPVAVNGEGDLPIDLVADTKVEGVIQRGMEGAGHSEAEIEDLRVRVEVNMLEDMKIASGADTVAPREFGATWLHVAAANGWVEALQTILDKPGVNPNVADAEGNTPMHLASFFSQYEAVMHLAAKGASFDALNHLKQKPIILSEDETMIRLITALEKKAQGAALKAPVDAKGGVKSQRSISRGRRGQASRKDVMAESKLRS